MPDFNNNQTILDQILLEVRALQSEVSERLLFIEKRIAEIDHHTSYIANAWAETTTTMKTFERRMIDLERKSTQ